jgi:hypothetical protein
MVDRMKLFQWFTSKRSAPIVTNAVDSGVTKVEDLHGKPAVPRGYFGSKAGCGVWHTIVNQIPPHTLWIEAFAGGAAITRRKRPAAAAIVIEADPAVAANLQTTLPGTRVINADAISWLTKHVAEFNQSTVIYCDPPYIGESRDGGHRRRYGMEMREEWLHSALLEALHVVSAQGAQCLVSHYPHPLYERALASWRRVDYTAQTHGGPRRECLWCSFPEPTELHEYSVAGANFRARQNLRRKQARWVARLAAMPTLERAAVIAAIDEWRRSTTAKTPIGSESAKIAL